MKLTTNGMTFTTIRINGKVYNAVAFDGRIFTSVHLTDMRIPECQRTLNKGAVNTNASDVRYDKRAMRCIVVSLRKDGLCWIIDGQHRYRMAEMRNPDALLFCEIHQGLTIEQEAALFKTLNNQKSVSPAAKFRAGVIEGCADCLTIMGIVSSEGFNICLAPGKPTTINNLTNISAILRVYGMANGILRNTLRIIKELYSIAPDDGRISPVVLGEKGRGFDLFLRGFAEYLFRNPDVTPAQVVRALEDQDAPDFKRQVLKEANGAVRKDAVPAFVRVVALKMAHANKRR
jgi:hypothetical protein